MARTLLERAARWAKDQLDVSTSIVGDYGRATHSRTDLKAVPRLPGFQEQSVGEATLLSAEAMDFVFAVDELIVNSEKIEPSAGDWWRFVRPDGKVNYYDVLPDSSGRCYSISDNLGILARVHMKLSRVEDLPDITA